MGLFCEGGRKSGVFARKLIGIKIITKQSETQIPIIKNLNFEIRLLSIKVRLGLIVGSISTPIFREDTELKIDKTHSGN